MGKHSAEGITYWEARRRRRDLRNRNKPPRRKQPTKKRWFVLVFIIGLMVGGAIGYYAKPLARLGARLYLSFKERQWQPEGKEKEEVAKSLTVISGDPDRSVNTLVLGSDSGSNKREKGWCRSDVMMLVCLHERDRKAVVLSIPRDTRVQLPGGGTDKINAAHSYGGPSGAIDAVRRLTGIDIHHYISINFEGFKKVIDSIGGVPIHLSKPINDPHAGRLPAGDLLLDGEQALVVVRSRKLPGGDIDRIKSQHAFLKALMKKANEMKNAWKAKQLVDILASTCSMDYSGGELMTLFEELKSFDIGSVQFVTIPGTPKNIGGASYYVVDEAVLARLVDEVKRYTAVSEEMMAALRRPSESQTFVQELYGPTADVIKVLSGSRANVGAATVVAEELRLLGHEIVTHGTTKMVAQKTAMYHRREALDACRGIQKMIPELRGAELAVDDQITSEHNSPVVIVLGADFVTPNMLSIYGRLIQPAVRLENLGRRVKSFG